MDEHLIIQELVHCWTHHLLEWSLSCRFQLVECVVAEDEIPSNVEGLCDGGPLPELTTEEEMAHQRKDVEHDESKDAEVENIAQANGYGACDEGHLVVQFGVLEQTKRAIIAWVVAWE